MTQLTLDRVDPSQQATLANLFELYAYDFSATVPIEVGPDGRFGHDVSTWLKDRNRAAYFIRSGGKLAGFALLRRGSHLDGAPDVMDVGEFFVLRYLRRRGLGKLAARAVFALHPGRWEVRVRVQNQNALAFWSDVVDEVAAGTQRSEQLQKADVHWQVFHFDNTQR
ncbi:MAG TPA: GNAT family N-acetyltransferase [Polyangiales bacterium]|nr:GNAT family N-acetyltransferase [Polyangiales bacterium]